MPYQDDQEDDENKIDETDVADNETPEAPQAPAPAAATPPSVDQDEEKMAKIKDYLAQQFAQANDNSEVKKAQDRAQHNNTVANIGDALETLAKSNSMAHGGAGVDSGFYKGIKEQGQQGIQQAQANRQAAIQNFTQQNMMNRQVLEDMMKKGTYDQQQKIAKILNDANDSSSQVSQNAQAGFKSLMSHLPGVANMDLSKYSKADIDDLSKNADVMAKINSAEDLKKLLFAQQQDRINQQHELVDQQNAVKDFKGLQGDLDTQKASVRTGLGQAQAKVNGAVKLMGFVDTNPQEIDEAKRDPQAKAAIIAKMNKMSPQQYSEIVSGLMSQISGGQGSFGQLESLRAPTASQTKANVEQYFSDHPIPANMGEFIFNNLQTLKNEQDISQNIIDSHHGKMKALHPKAFSHPYTQEGAEGALKAFSSVPDQAANSAQPVGQLAPASVHPEANQAAEWAKAHPDDPRATEILKRLGGMNAGL